MAYSFLWNVVVALVLALLAGGVLVAGLFLDRVAGNHRRPRCRKCRYDMRGVAPASGTGSVRCPECGKEHTSAKQLLFVRRRWGVLLPGLLLLAGSTWLVVSPALASGLWVRGAPSWVLVRLWDANTTYPGMELSRRAASGEINWGKQAVIDKALGHAGDLNAQQRRIALDILMVLAPSRMPATDYTQILLGSDWTMAERALKALPAEERLAAIRSALDPPPAQNAQYHTVLTALGELAQQNDEAAKYLVELATRGAADPLATAAHFPAIQLKARAIPHLVDRARQGSPAVRAQCFDVLIFVASETTDADVPRLIEFLRYVPEEKVTSLGGVLQGVFIRHEDKGVPLLIAALPTLPDSTAYAVLGSIPIPADWQTHAEVAGALLERAGPKLKSAFVMRLIRQEEIPEGLGAKALAALDQVQPNSVDRDQALTALRGSDRSIIAALLDSPSPARRRLGCEILARSEPFYTPAEARLRRIEADPAESEELHVAARDALKAAGKWQPAPK